VFIIVVFFAAGATNSTPQMTFTNTNSRFFHIFVVPELLIGFELLEIITKFKDGLGGLRSLDL